MLGLETTLTDWVVIRLVANTVVRQGRSATSKVRINWAKQRQCAAWPMIGLFGIGSVSLWTSAIIKVSTSGGFAGILSWQVLGAPLPIYRGGLTAHRACKRDKNGRLPPLAMRRRLWTIVAIVTANVLCNGWVIFRLVQLWLGGRFTWSTQDKWAFAIALITTVLLIGGKLLGWLGFDALLFWLVVTYRAIPQALLAVSPDLVHISWWTLGGVALIAIQGLGVYAIELGFAKTEFSVGAIDQPNLAKARWTFRAEACNTASIAAPVIAKVLL